MGLFGKKDASPKPNEGGLMDAIRCDEQDYLIWKWRPKGEDVNTTKKENAIRWGSSLNVKDGEVAVFLYHQKDGTQMDCIEGPYNGSIKTANFPILSSIVGLAFGGGTPFQAEIYYINLAGLIRVQFAVPYFDMFDPRLPDFPVSMAVRGSFMMSITDYKEFIKLHRLSNFDMEQFKDQTKDSLIKYVKGVAVNIPDGSYGGAPIPIVQMEKRILQVNDIVEQYIKPKMQEIYGVTVKDFNISELDVDKTCEGYKKINNLTADYTENTLKTQQNINIQSMQEANRLQMEQLAETQRMQLKNMEETLRINREEGQFAQHQTTEANAYAAKLGAEQQNIGAFAVKNQTQVGIAAAEAMGKAGSAGVVNLGSGGAGGNGNGGANNMGGINPGAMMANMAIGQSVGMGMANMLGNAFSGASTGMGAGTMPGSVMYNVAVNGASTGPYSVEQLSKMVQGGQLTAQSLVWTTGMANWTAAGSVPDLAGLFVTQTGAVPPVPPVPPPLN
ncbi:MAG: SPFH domain-containing protein [Treponema sp.]|nr:SPFH domain-containing protein [Treponema sp.]